MCVGRIIASERVRAGMTQRQLASRIGVAQTTVANWEKDRTEPTGKSLKSMSREFGCSIDYLLGLSDERKAS